jgi:hypothetical protein
MTSDSNRTIAAMAALAAVLLSAAAVPAARQDPPIDTLRLRGQVLVEGGGPLAGARIQTDALRGPSGTQFAGQRRLMARTGSSGEWSLLGVTRGLWVLEISAVGHLPHVVVVPIAMMRRPEPVPWDTSVALLPEPLVTAGGDRAGQRVIDAADRMAAGDPREAREALLSLGETSLGAPALCAAGDVALLLREPALGRRFFELAASASPAWYRPHLGIASASMMLYDFDRAIKAYDGARSKAANARLERMISSAIRELQEIRTIGRGAH